MGSWEFDLLTGVVSWTETMFDILELDPALGTPGYAENLALYLPEDAARLADAVNLAVSEARPYTLDMRRIMADGTQRWYLAQGRPLKSGDRVVRLVGTCQDVTEARRSKEALRASERRMREAVENLPAGAVFVEGDRIFLNRAAEELTGYTRDELQTLESWFGVLYPGRVEQIRRLYEGDRAAGFPAAPIVPLTRKDGTVRQVEFAAYGWATGEVWVLHDVTARLEAEAERRMVAQILDNTTDLVAMTRLDMTLTYMNAAGLKMLGLERADLKLFRPEDVHPPDVAAQIRAETIPTAIRDGVWQGESVFVDKSGGLIPASLVAQCHRDAQGEAAFISLIARDISDRMRTEMALQESAARLHEAQAVAKVGSWSHDIATGRMTWSTEMCRLIGLESSGSAPSLEQLLNRCHTDDVAMTAEAFRKASVDGSGYEFDVRINLEDWSVRWLHIIGNTECGEDCSLTRLYGTARDITREKEYEAQLEAVNNWLQEANQKLIEQQADMLAVNTLLELQMETVNDQRELLERQKAELEEANSRLEVLAKTDGLTGLMNHRAFQEQLTWEYSRSQRSGEPFSVVLLDVDQFKEYNDTYGHPEGDKILRSVAEILSSQVRQADLVARYGGEEFVLLLPETGALGAIEVAERCRAAIAEHEWPCRRVTASFGVSTFGAATGAAAELTDSADRALYMSKERGRNRVVHSADVDSGGTVVR